MSLHDREAAAVEQELARAEIKIRKITNGWLLKGRNWQLAFTAMPDLLAAIERKLTEDVAEEQPRFFHKDWPGPRQ